jgi:DNA-binding CsgD family transcriptional regulator
MSAALLEGVFERAADATTDLDLERALVEFTERHECTSANLMTVVESADGQATFANVLHMPPGYMESFNDLEGARFDPVMGHLRRSSMPLLWTRQTYSAVQQAREWEHMEAHGLSCGAAIALHMPGGRHLALGLDRRSPLPTAPARLTALLGEMQLLLSHVTESAFKIHDPIHQAADLRRNPTPALTPRELEALRWTIDGKTAWEIGQIMAITERTAVKHLANATTKLQCATKAQAAIQAIRLGLVR